jgi:3-oxoacyl-[acyl-carrier protein] reductase
MELGLRKRIACVAGASQGLGRAVARALAAEGCDLLLASRSEAALAALSDELHAAHGVDVSFVACDLDGAEGTARVVDAVRERHGRVDVLVTNNGGPPTGTFLDTDDMTWTLAWNRTLMSAVRLIRGLLPGMIAQGSGRVINITSISAKQPVQRLLLSNAYRAAVTGMARTLSDEVAAHGVTVNCIAPGFIATDRLVHLFEDRARQSERTPEEERAATVGAIPAGRLGDPAEVGALAAFLASDAAGYITGTTIQIDGGLHRGLL